MIYLDNSATTKVYDEVVDVMTYAMKEGYGNPSSLHAAGLEAEKALKAARKSFGDLLGRKSKEIFFTSGGTESDNTAVIGGYEARKRQSKRVITTRIEHPAVLKTMELLESRGAEIVYIDVDKDSIFNLDQFREEIAKGAAMVSVMAVNNETGALMPLCHIKDEIDKAGCKAIFHSDGVQALGKEDVRNMPGDILSFSGHKIHGPKGVGAIYVKEGLKLSPLMVGGGQETGFRSGTENLPGILGFSKALEMSLENFDENRQTMIAMRDALKKGILEEIEDIRINSPEDGCPGILNVSFLGTRGEVILHTLEQDGIMVSTGAACSSGKNAHKAGSHVLKAMGLPEESIEGAIRFSFGAYNTMDEIPFVVDKLKTAVSNFRRLGTFR